MNTIVMFGGKRGRLASRRTPSQPWSKGWQHHVVGVLCCRRDWCTSQNRWHHEEGKWCGYMEATSQVRKLKLGRKTWLSYTSSVRMNGPKFTQIIVGSLWKATRNIWPKLNILKAMLPNTNWVYVNFWPTGNVMKEIKAEINHSLYYYSDISHS